MNFFSSRASYTALTPEYADFVLPTSSNPIKKSSNLHYLSNASEDDHEFDESAPNESPRYGFQAARTRAKEIVKNNIGLLLVAASQAFFSFVNVAVKKLNSIDPPVSALELVAVRMTITYICCMTYMLSTNVPDPFLGPKGVRLLLVFRGFTGFFGLFGVYFSLQYLSLSDATILTFLAPMCTAVAGALLLGESFTRREALASFVSLIGVVLIARPSMLFGNSSSTSIPGAGEIVSITSVDEGQGEVASSQRLLAVGVALVGVLGATGAFTSLRAIGNRAHPLHALTSFSIQCVVVSVIAMIATHAKFVIPARLDWLALLVMIGIFGFVAQVLLTMGLQRETAGRGTMAVYTQIIFASILERVFFHNVPSFSSICGTLMILSSAAYVALTKGNKPKHSDAVSLQTALEVTPEEGLLELSDDVNYYRDQGKAEQG